MKKIRTAVLVAATVIGGLGLAGCSSDADVVSKNLSKEADNFKVWRQIVLYNGITDKYVLEIDGYCSLGNSDASDRVTVTCKVDSGNGSDAYTKDVYLKSDNTMVFAHQIKGVDVSPDHYKVVLKPETVIPDFDVR